jgi:hypothetical protein
VVFFLGLESWVVFRLEKLMCGVGEVGWVGFTNHERKRKKIIILIITSSFFHLRRLGQDPQGLYMITQIVRYKRPSKGANNSSNKLLGMIVLGWKWELPHLGENLSKGPPPFKLCTYIMFTFFFFFPNFVS